MEELNSNKMLYHLKDDMRIVAALINCFRVRVESDKKFKFEIAQKLRERVLLENHLERLVFQFDKKKTIMMRKVTSNLLDFLDST